MGKTDKNIELAKASSQVLTLNKREFIAWCEGILLQFRDGRGFYVNETECMMAEQALEAGKVILLRNEARLTGTQLVLRKENYCEEYCNFNFLANAGAPAGDSGDAAF